jgi:hypothetical protein
MMGKLSNFCRAATRSNVMIRLITNFVMMISDADVVFSPVFMHQLLSHGEKYTYFFLVICVGNLTYAAGAGYFAPNQKYKTMKLVKDLMISSPEEFVVPRTVTSSRPYKVQTQSPVDPSSTRGLTFGAVEMTPEGFESFKAGIVAYNLAHIWNACEIKNARNCFERKHGIPFFRLARIGFMSEPSPKDLSGILNANALYTFSTGLLQIAFGATMGYEFGLTFETVLPLSISSFSLLLSFANVTLDFAGILTEIEAERRLKDTILQASAGTLKRDKDVARATQEEEKTQIEQEFHGKNDASSLASKVARLKEVSDNYELRLHHIDTSNLNQLSTELRNYRVRVERIRRIVSGQDRLPLDQNHQNVTSVDAVIAGRQQIATALNEQKQKVIDAAVERIGQLDMNAADGPELLNQILADRDRKVAQLDDAISSTVAGTPATDRV